VYGIITRAGGHARFHSRPGVGTTFVALLPAESNRLDAEATPPAQADVEPAGTTTILLVEDERALREVTRRILADAGYVVLEADCGENALAVAAGHDGTIDMLLTDIMMPGMLGPHLAEHLTAERHGLRVLYMSGFSEWLLGQATQIGSSALIEKPFTAPALLERVRSALASEPAR
jgi:two-component system cell cycle sensor histidine kinase/response regulator CckA